MSKSHSNLLDRIEVPAPCTADWDAMKGNDQVRFCTQCSLNVHNLSAMTRKEARKLIADSGGKLCIRYAKKPSGALQTVASEQLHHIKRRVSRFAVGAFTAALSLSASVVASAQTNAAQGDSSGANKAAASLLVRDLSLDEKVDDKGTQTSSIAGTIVDLSGTAVPRARITLTNEKGEPQRFAMTDNEGKFDFQNLDEGLYNVKVSADGFAEQEITNMLVRSSGEQQVVTTLITGETTAEIQQVEFSGGGAIMVMPDNPLVKAAFENNLEAVRALLAQGVEVNVVDKDVEVTPLAEAVAQGNLEMVRALLAAGADVNQKNKYGHTALMSLDEDSTAEMVTVLVAAGAKVNHKDEEGNTALMNAASTATPSLLQALIDAGAKVDAKNKDGDTALMRAAEDGNVENVKVLIQADATLNLRDKDGNTALKRARENEQEEVVKLLESYGAIE